jgi:hypothetical protein
MGVNRVNPVFSMKTERIIKNEARRPREQSIFIQPVRAPYDPPPDSAVVNITYWDYSKNNKNPGGKAPFRKLIS